MKLFDDGEVGSLSMKHGATDKDIFIIKQLYPEAKVTIQKELVVFLDFDGVLNSQGTSINGKRRKEGFRDNPKVEGIEWEINCMKNTIELFDRLSKKVKVTVVLNTAWKMCAPQRCIAKYNNTELGIKYPCSEATPTYHFHGGNYNCKSFEIESYIVQKDYTLDKTLFLCLDDDVKQEYFKYIPVINYRVDGVEGLTLEDKDIICKEILKHKCEYEV